MIYNIDELRKAYNEGKKFKFVFFGGHTPPKDGSVDKSCFSQWWLCPFTVEGTQYSCAEQFMMAEKARLFGDDEMLESILKAKHPKEMKAFGRAVKTLTKIFGIRNVTTSSKEPAWPNFRRIRSLTIILTRRRTASSSRLARGTVFGGSAWASPIRMLRIP